MLLNWKLLRISQEDYFFHNLHNLLLNSNWRGSCLVSMDIQEAQVNCERNSPPKTFWATFNSITRFKIKIILWSTVYCLVSTLYCPLHTVYCVLLKMLYSLPEDILTNLYDNKDQNYHLFSTTVWCLLILATIGHFGNSGQSEVSESDPKWFPMSKNLGIDTKIKSVAVSKPKLGFRGYFAPPLALFWPKFKLCENFPTKYFPV